MTNITLGYSPCPNDTYIFYALVHNMINDAPKVCEVLEDIETLNKKALSGVLDATKISFHAFLHLREQYCLLHSGGALGYGCGPLIVSRSDVDPLDLHKLRVAIPGRLTTAALLLRLFDPKISNLVVMPFHEIMRAVEQGHVDAGVIIHESRFTYPVYGLRKILDLGEWWELNTGHAIPLGGILIRRDFGVEFVEKFDLALYSSIEYAQTHPQDVVEYVCTNAQEMDLEVVQSHINLYVNRHTLDYGREGEAAIAELIQRSEDLDLVPKFSQSLFVV